MDHHHKIELSRSVQQGVVASQLLRENNGMLTAIGNSLDVTGIGLIRQETEKGMEITMITNKNQAVDCLGSRLNDLAIMSKGQNAPLLEKIEQLQSQVEELKALHGQAPTAISSTGRISDHLEQAEENKILANDHRVIEPLENVKKLCSLTRKPGSTVFSHEAQGIISDVENILIFISECPQFTEINESRKRKHDQTDEIEFPEVLLRRSQLQLDMEKMRGLLTSSEHVSINQQGLSYETRFNFSFPEPY